MEANTSLNNPLLSYAGVLPGDFSAADLDFDALRDFTGLDIGENEYSALHSNHRGYIGEDGNIYRKELRYTGDGQLPEGWEVGDEVPDDMVREYTDERLYFWSPPQELGRAPNSEAAQEQAMAGSGYFGSGGLYTKAEIQEAWDAEEGMGYLKQFTTWDKYWSFIEQTTKLFTDPEYNDITGGNMTSGNWQDSPEYMALLQATGVPTQYINDDGDVFNFNGTTYEKDYKTDDSIPIGVVNKLLLGGALGFLAAPMVAGALTPALGVAGAKAAAAGIASIAAQAMTDGKINWEDALLGAALAYGGNQLSEALQNSGVMGEIGSFITEYGDNIADGGGEVLTAAFQAGGMSIVSQMVRDGEIDWKGAAISAAMAGGTVMLGRFLADIGYEGKEDEILQEISVTAQRKGTQVGNGVWMLEDGTVIGDNGNVLGNMSDLDLNGDGALTGNDLANINPRTDYVAPTYSNTTVRPRNENPLNGGGIRRRYYLDADGRIYSGSNVKQDGNGLYSSIDGTRLTSLQGVYDEDTGLYLFKDGNGNITQVADKSGKIVSIYDSGNKVWTNADGTPNAEYDRFLTERYNSGSTTAQDLNNPFATSRDDYDALTGEQLLDDYFAKYGYDNRENMQIALTNGQMRELVDRFGSVSELEAYFQENGYGIHHSSENGWRIEAGVDTSDGVYGNFTDGSYVTGILGDPSGPQGAVRYDPDGNPTTVNDTTTENPFNKTDPPPQTTQDTTNSGNQNAVVGGPSTGAPSTPGSGAKPGDNPSNNPVTPPVNNTGVTDAYLATVAQITGQSVSDVIAQINNGTTVAEIIAKADGDTPTPAPNSTTNGNVTADTTPPSGSTTGDDPGSGDPNNSSGNTSGANDTSDPATNNDGTGSSGTVGAGGDDTSGDDDGTTSSDGSGGKGDEGSEQGESGNNTGTSTEGPGTGASDEGYDDGLGNGTGDGMGDGNGNGNGNGNGLFGGIGGDGGSNTEWTPLFGGPRFNPRWRQFKSGSFAPQPKQLPSFASQDYSTQRMGLLSQAYKDIS